MNIRVYYNKEMFPTVLIARYNHKPVSFYEKKKNVTKLFDNKKEVIGYNIETEFNSEKSGYLCMNDELLSFINTQLKDSFQEEIVYDYNNPILVGKVIECEDHPDSDHLHICKVDIQSEVLQIVCGASNVFKGATVVVACIGAILPSGLLIEKGKLRGVESYGMLCSEYELGFIQEHKKGLLLLDDTYEIGSHFFKEG